MITYAKRNLYWILVVLYYAILATFILCGCAGTDSQRATTIQTAADATSSAAHIVSAIPAPWAAITGALLSGVGTGLAAWATRVAGKAQKRADDVMDIVVNTPPPTSPNN